MLANRRTVRALSGVAAAVLALIIWVIAVPVFDVKLDFVDIQGKAQTVVPGAVILMSIVPALAGWAFVALLERFANRAAKLTWTIVASLALLLSMVPVLGLTGGAAVTLGLMHVVVGVVIILAMRNTAKPVVAQLN